MRDTRWLRALGAAGVLLLSTSCGGEGNAPRGGDLSDVSALAHVHGLGVDPGDDSLYAATHLGVFQIGEGGELDRVADRWQDTMAFTVVGPGHFLGSGHPDLSEDLPTHLGLIESVDAAESWSILSLGGEVDFHALDVSGTRIYGYDATTGQILTSTDRETWETIATAPVVDLAADPASSERIVTSAPDGTLRFWTMDSPDPAILEDAPPVVLLDWPAEDVLVGVTGSGDVYLSDDTGASWAVSGRVPGTPEAFDATEEEWHVATDRGIYRSDDDGRTWSAVVAAEH